MKLIILKRRGRRIATVRDERVHLFVRYGPVECAALVLDITAKRRYSYVDQLRHREPPVNNDLLRPVGTYLYGRRMYETMIGWETMDTAGQAQFTRDFAEIWRAADKIVYSKTLAMVSSARTRIERDFDPEAVRHTKMLAGRDITVAGPSLAAHAIKAGLVDEYHLIISPILVGGGKQSQPNHVLLRLDLLAERRFGNGVVHLHYRPKRVS
jgi:dihydrofolate reductase